MGLLLVILSATATSTYALPYDSIVLDRQDQTVNIAPYLWWSEDRNNRVMLEDIVYQRTSMPWRKGDENNPNFGLGVPPHWFRLKITNPTLNDMERWLEISYPVLDQVEVYQLADGQVVRSYITGDSYPFSERPLAHRHFIFPLSFKAQHNYEVYIRVATLGALQLPAQLWEPKAFVRQDQWKLAAQLLFTGIMLAMAGYNLILWLLIREPTYLLYVFYVVSIAIVQLTLHGTSYQFFWPEQTYWNQYQMIFFIGSSMTFAGLFSYRFLNLYRTHILLGRLLLIGTALGIMTAIMAFTVGYVASVKTAVFTVGIMSVLLMGTGIYLWFQREPNAGLFTLGWTVFLIGNISIVLAKVGILPNLAIIEYGPQIGSTFEVFLFSVALAQRINLERRKRLVMQEHALQMERQAREAQQEMLQAQKKANDELERRVALRTEELQQAMSELSRANAQLQEFAVKDQLTQLYAAQHFFPQLKDEWSRCARSLSSLSVVLISIDGFEMINRKYGQLAADTYLIELGKILLELTDRAGDRTYRLDEDRFALLLPHSAIENALHIAERLRSYSEAKLIVVEGHRFSTTLSIGIATEIPDLSAPHEELIERAQTALELSRSQGGNTVQFAL